MGKSVMIIFPGMKLFLFTSFWPLILGLSLSPDHLRNGNQQENWISHFDSNLEFFFTGVKKSFDEARSFCTEKGGKLYEPRDADIMNDVSNHANEAGIGDYWLG